VWANKQLNELARCAAYPICGNRPWLHAGDSGRSVTVLDFRDRTNRVDLITGDVAVRVFCSPYKEVGRGLDRQAVG